MKLGQAIRKVPGFRSGSKIKAIIASVFYLLAIFFILLIIIPTPKSETSQTEKQPTPIPSPEATIELTPEVKGEQAEEVLVTRVVDGDTIEIEGEKKVRYIGIDTPETVHPEKPIECYGKEASDKNKKLVLGKKVKLEKDVSETDKYDRLLRYVWVGDLMVNEYLVREGYAQSSTYPPDVKYQDRFVEAQRKAREENKGLWSSFCETWGQAIPTPTPTTKSKTYPCDCSKTCTQISSCEEAYYQLNACGCSIRDGDKDGVPCENICPGG